MREIVPRQFDLDMFDGQAWIGIVPFTMTAVRPRCVPAIPNLMSRPNPSHFLELNVRTYVRHDDRLGVFFFSLDAQSRLAVWGARRFVHLPYFNARMRCERRDEGWLEYNSQRTHGDAPSASLSIRYRPVPDSVPQSGPLGSLEHFLTERYCLYTFDGRDRVLRGDIHHAPWPLQAAECQIEDLEMTADVGIELPTDAPLLHFAQRLEVVAWWNVRA